MALSRQLEDVARKQGLSLDNEYLSSLHQPMPPLLYIIQTAMHVQDQQHAIIDHRLRPLLQAAEAEPELQELTLWLSLYTDAPAQAAKTANRLLSRAEAFTDDFWQFSTRIRLIAEVALERGIFDLITTSCVEALLDMQMRESHFPSSYQETWRILLPWIDVLIEDARDEEAATIVLRFYERLLGPPRQWPEIAQEALAQNPRSSYYSQSPLARIRSLRHTLSIIGRDLQRAPLLFYLLPELGVFYDRSSLPQQMPVLYSLKDHNAEEILLFLERSGQLGSIEELVVIEGQGTGSGDIRHNSLLQIHRQLSELSDQAALALDAALGEYPALAARLLRTSLPHTESAQLIRWQLLGEHLSAIERAPATVQDALWRLLGNEVPTLQELGWDKEDLERAQAWHARWMIEAREQDLQALFKLPPSSNYFFDGCLRIALEIWPSDRLRARDIIHRAIEHQDQSDPTRQTSTRHRSMHPDRRSGIERLSEDLFTRLSRSQNPHALALFLDLLQHPGSIISPPHSIDRMLGESLHRLNHRNNDPSVFDGSLRQSLEPLQPQEDILLLAPALQRFMRRSNWLRWAEERPADGSILDRAWLHATALHRSQSDSLLLADVVHAMQEGLNPSLRVWLGQLLIRHSKNTEIDQSFQPQWLDLILSSYVEVLQATRYQRLLHLLDLPFCIERSAAQGNGEGALKGFADAIQELLKESNRQRERAWPQGIWQDLLLLAMHLQDQDLLRSLLLERRSELRQDPNIYAMLLRAGALDLAREVWQAADGRLTIGDLNQSYDEQLHVALDAFLPQIKADWPHQGLLLAIALRILPGSIERGGQEIGPWQRIEPLLENLSETIPDLQQREQVMELVFSARLGQQAEIALAESLVQICADSHPLILAQGLSSNNQHRREQSRRLLRWHNRKLRVQLLQGDAQPLAQRIRELSQELQLLDSAPSPERHRLSQALLNLIRKVFQRSPEKVSWPLHQRHLLRQSIDLLIPLFEQGLHNQRSILLSLLVESHHDAQGLRALLDWWQEQGQPFSENMRLRSSWRVAIRHWRAGWQEEEAELFATALLGMLQEASFMEKWQGDAGFFPALIEAGLLTADQILQLGEALATAGPRRGHAWAELAVLFAEAGRLEEAIAAYRRAEEQPSNQPWLRNWSRLRQNLERRQAEEQQAKDAADAASTEEQAHE